ncbi:MAG: hypothetical protein JWM80_4600 [Cyanobacteria bacterium RYN_339]|nr:hypothetical protein [Cyanobacteria bacterium RYN_339]
MEQAGFHFTLTATTADEATLAATAAPAAGPLPERSVTAPETPVTAPPASPEPSATPSSSGIVYSGGGGSGGGGAPPPPPPPPGVILGATDGGFTDPAATETAAVGP